MPDNKLELRAQVGVLEMLIIIVRHFYQKVDIAAGEEITIQYITFLFGNTRRRRDIHQCWWILSSPLPSMHIISLYLFINIAFDTFEITPTLWGTNKKRISFLPCNTNVMIVVFINTSYSNHHQHHCHQKVFWLSVPSMPRPNGVWASFFCSREITTMII